MRRNALNSWTPVLLVLVACSEGAPAPATLKRDPSKSRVEYTAVPPSDGGSSSGGSDSGSDIPNVAFPDCAVVPANPNATQQARNLLCYLYSIYGKSVLSGQQETSWNPNPADDVNWIQEQTGTYPAVLGGDYLYPSGTSSRAKAWWQAGGIPMIRYHMGAPPLDDSYDNSKGKADIDAVLTVGTQEHSVFVQRLDYAAGELEKLQRADVPVLWAPFHEAQPNGWFWWSKGTGDQYVALWKYMFEYFTNGKGLNNLVWLLPFSGSPNASFYPGKEYTDLAGPDTYDKLNQPFANLYSRSAKIIGSEIPIPLHETGSIPDPDQMFPDVAPWVLFNIWCDFRADPEYNPEGRVRAAYASPYVITRDEVPNLK